MQTQISQNLLRAAQAATRLEIKPSAPLAQRVTSVPVQQMSQRSVQMERIRCQTGRIV